MKKIKNTHKTNFLKKIFIKLCRLIGFEIIDQSNFKSPTLEKDLNETLSIQGKKSITIPLGQIDIKNKIDTTELEKPRNSIKLYKTSFIPPSKLFESELSSND